MIKLMEQNMDRETPYMYRAPHLKLQHTHAHTRTRTHTHTHTHRYTDMNTHTNFL